MYIEAKPSMTLDEIENKINASYVELTCDCDCDFDDAHETDDHDFCACEHSCGIECSDCGATDLDLIYSIDDSQKLDGGYVCESCLDERQENDAEELIAGHSDILGMLAKVLPELELGHYYDGSAKNPVHVAFFEALKRQLEEFDPHFD